MFELNELTVRTRALRSRYDQELGALEQIKQRLTWVRAQHADLAHQAEVFEAVRFLFAHLSEMARAQVKTHVENVVTSALQAVFGTDMRFEILLRDGARGTEAEWRVVDAMDGQEVAGEPESSRGGGITDIVSLALRFALLELIRPKPQGILMLDEPCKHVSAEHRPAAAEWIKSYVAATGRQCLIVTHHEEFASVADVAYRVEKSTAGVSEVTRL